MRGGHPFAWAAASGSTRERRRRLDEMRAELKSLRGDGTARGRARRAALAAAIRDSEQRRRPLADRVRET